LRQALEVHPLDHLALLHGQLAERRAHDLALARQIDRREDVVDRILHDPGSEPGGLLGAPPLRLFPTHGVDRPMVHGPHEPGADRSTSTVVPLGVPPHGEERLLHDLLGHLCLTDQAEREGVGHGRVPAEQLAERLVVTGAHPTQELLVPGARGLNRAHRSPGGADRHRCARDARLSCGRMVAGGIRRSSRLG
jgi:hypothetical protein